MTYSPALAVVCQLYQLNISSYSGALYVCTTQLTKQEALHSSRVDSIEIVEHQVSNQELRCISVLKYFHQATTLFMQYQDICALPCSVYMQPLPGECNQRVKDCNLAQDSTRAPAHVHEHL